MILLRLYTSFLFVFYLTYADIWLGSNGFISFRVKVFLIFSLFVYSSLLFLQGARGFRMIECNIVSNLAGIAPFVAMTIISMLWISMPDAFSGEDDAYFKNTPVAFTIFLLSMTIPLFAFFIGKWRFYLTLPLLVLVGSVCFDLYSPGTFSKVYVRSAGLGWEPNQAGFGIVLLCSVIVTYGKFRYTDLVIIVMTFLAAFATLSRGSLVIFTIFVISYCYYGRKNLTGPLTLAGSIAAIVASVYGAMYLVDHSDLFNNREAQNRLEVLTLQRNFVGDDAGIERRMLVQQGIALVDESVLLGHGTGFTGRFPERLHNMYLEQWVNNGVPGLFSYVWLLTGAYWLFWRRNFATGKVFVAIIVVEGVFSHTIVESRLFQMLYGMLLTVSWMEAQQPMRARRVFRRSRPPDQVGDVTPTLEAGAERRPSRRHTPEEERVVRDLGCQSATGRDERG